MAKSAHSCCILRNTLNSVQDNVTRVIDYGLYKGPAYPKKLRKEKKNLCFPPLSKSSIQNRERN